MATEQIVKRLQALHPQCLIRDIQIEAFLPEVFKVSYIKVSKDDTWVRCKLHLVVEDKGV
jgi:hypothetical protein